MLGGPPIVMHPDGFDRAPQYVGAPRCVQAPPRMAPSAPARMPTAAPASPPPVLRAKGTSEPRVDPIALPSPEQLGVSPRSDIDWTETRRLLDTLGATEAK